MDISFRPLLSADQPFLWEMCYHAVHVPAGQPPYPREIVHMPEISRYVQDWGKSSDLGFIAQDEEKPIGAVWARLLVGDNKGYGYVDESTPELSMALMPEYRGKGIGSQLLTRLLEAAVPRYAAICLSVSLDNPAQRLYQRMGFEIVSENESAFTMIKRFH